MPVYIRRIGIYGNVALAAVFGVVALIVLPSVGIATSLFCAIVAVLGGFNVYAIRTASLLTSEEGWLQSEIRKAELRKKLEAYGDPGVVRVDGSH